MASLPQWALNRPRCRGWGHRLGACRARMMDNFKFLHLFFLFLCSLSLGWCSSTRPTPHTVYLPAHQRLPTFLRLEGLLWSFTPPSCEPQHLPELGSCGHTEHGAAVRGAGGCQDTPVALGWLQAGGSSAPHPCQPRPLCSATLLAPSSRGVPALGTHWVLTSEPTGKPCVKHLVLMHEIIEQSCTG